MLPQKNKKQKHQQHLPNENQAKNQNKKQKQKQKQSSTSFEPGRQRPETCSFSRVRGELKNLYRTP